MLLQHVGDSVLAIVHALDEHHRAVCNGRRGMCPAISMQGGTNRLAAMLIPILKTINFTGKLMSMRDLIILELNVFAITITIIYKESDLAHMTDDFFPG